MSAASVAIVIWSASSVESDWVLDEAAAGHLALYANSQRCWFDLPSHVAALVKTMYGDLAPPAPRCPVP